MIETITIHYKIKECGSRSYILPKSLTDKLKEFPEEAVIISSVLLKAVLKYVDPIHKEATEAALINAIAASLVGIDPTENNFTYN